MSELARGTFEVAVTAEESADGLGHFRIEKTWSGDLTGVGHGLMLSAGDPTSQRAGYVALEVVDGTLHGRAGRLAFQQLGVMRPDAQELTYLVVPGSGTDELAGIEGTLALTIDDGGHTYGLSYTLG